MLSCPTYPARLQPAFGARTLSQDRLRLQKSVADSDGSTAAPEEDSERASLASCVSEDLLASARSVLSASQSTSCIALFDWDDTLMPTTLLYNQPGSGPVTDEMKWKHAKLVERTLRTAASIAHVSIVTLAERPWVLESAVEQLLGLDFPALLEELQITVYYAREYSASVSGLDWEPETVEDFVSLKRLAMAQSIEDRYATGSVGGTQMNILSVGDSVIERQALQDLLCGWEQSGQLLNAPLCKTVKLAEKPSLLKLHWELQQVLGAFSHMADLDHSVDLSVENWQFLQAQLNRNDQPNATDILPRGPLLVTW